MERGGGADGVEVVVGDEEGGVGGGQNEDFDGVGVGGEESEEGVEVRKEGVVEDVDGWVFDGALAIAS